MVKAFQIAQSKDFYEARGAKHPMGDIKGFTDYVPSRLSAEEAVRAIQGVPFEVVHDGTLHGTPAEIAAKLEPYAAAGLEHIAFWNVTFFADLDRVGSSYALLTEAKDEVKRLSV
jgi:alkanesulfonate monooxygenase SsuD/methylene tetrahydromethanopterin reductase-like flavin-dependent oxidoreductase (luciferase family)